MLRTIIFVTGILAGLWILLKIGFTLYYFRRAVGQAQRQIENAEGLSKAYYLMTAPFVVAFHPGLWRQIIGLVADTTLSATIYMFYGWTTGGQLGGGIASVLALCTSVIIFVLLELPAWGESYG